MTARLQLWWTVFSMCVAERLAYRGDFVLGTTMRFLPIVTQIFLWTAVFAGVNSIVGYTRNEMVAYYLLTMVARAFSSMPGLSGSIARQIREGEIKKFLIQPIDLIGFSLLARMGHKLVYYGVALVPFTVVFYLCGNFFPREWPSGEIWAAFIISLGLSFLLGFFLEISLGLCGFWTLEISSLLFVYMLFNFFFSGHMFPLEVVPEPYRLWFDVLPLKFLAYFPAAVYLGKVQEHLWWQIGIEAVWVMFFIVLSRVLMHRGFRRYSGFGG